MQQLPTGTILLWSGAIEDIPTGFVLCDGNNDTPDLTNRFIVGAGDSFPVDFTGGESQHYHDFTGDGHTHDLEAGGDIAAGTDYSATTSSANAYGGTDLQGHLPPYYALAYIMRT